MMAFIFLSVDLGANNDILEQIRAFDETREAHIIFGAYDVIVKAEFESSDDLSRFVVDKLKPLAGVLDTQTNVCA